MMTLTERPLLLPARETQLLALFMPQYHPISENSSWWGPGFTEWNNVTKARPLFREHYQPHLPADLGYYDLRLAETREAQAELAREAGLSGFCYYHYWFHGRRLLERPVDEMLASGRPDFPFCLCWANEPWSRTWDGESDNPLMPQNYSPEDDRAHFQWLLTAFADKRYLRIDGRPLFLIYRPSSLPNPTVTFALWRQLARDAGLPGLFLCSVESFPAECCDSTRFGLDAAIQFKPNCTYCGEPLRSNDPLEIGYLLHRVWDYSALIRRSLQTPMPAYPFFPCVCPSWDNSARRREGGTIFRNADPDQYGAWLEEVCYREQFRTQANSLVFVNAWNEWGEGNHLEPCEKWGHAYLQATRRALTSARQRVERIGLREGDLVTIAPGRRLQPAIDQVQRIGDQVLEASGWSVWAADHTPPSLVVFAEETGDGQFRLLRRMDRLHLSRPDVSAYLKTEAAYFSGWSGKLPLSVTTPGARLAALAFDANSGEFAGLGRLG